MQKNFLWLNFKYIKAVSNDRLIEELKFFDLDLSHHPKKNRTFRFRENKE